MPQLKTNPTYWLRYKDAVVVPRSRVAEAALLPEVGLDQGLWALTCTCLQVKEKALNRLNHGSLPLTGRNGCGVVMMYVY